MLCKIIRKAHFPSSSSGGGGANAEAGFSPPLRLKAACKNTLLANFDLDRGRGGGERGRGDTVKDEEMGGEVSMCKKEK